MFIKVYEDTVGNENVTANNENLWKWMIFNNKIIHVFFDKDALKQKLETVINTEVKAYNTERNKTHESTYNDSLVWLLNI